MVESRFVQLLPKAMNYFDLLRPIVFWAVRNIWSTNMIIPAFKISFSLTASPCIGARGRVRTRVHTSPRTLFEGTYM